MPFTSRLATAADYPIFTRLFPELGVPDPTPTLDHFTTHMLPRVVLLLEADAPIAYGFWQLYGKRAHVVHVVVDREARNRSAGRALIAAMRDHVIEEGASRWYLNVKRDNAAAIRLYERVGFHVALESAAMRIAWGDVSSLHGPKAAAFTPDAARDDAAIAARFAIDVERIGLLRARGCVLAAMRDDAAITAFTAFDPAFPGAYPFRVTRPELARPLLDALKPHARMDRFDFIRITVEGDAPLKQALTAAGAETSFEILQMEALLTP
jgi:GNAT superfamily N-acetyltransferase